MQCVLDVQGASPHTGRLVRGAKNGCLPNAPSAPTAVCASKQCWLVVCYSMCSLGISTTGGNLTVLLDRKGQAIACAASRRALQEPASESPTRIISVIGHMLDAPGAAYVLIALLLVGDPEGGASGTVAMDFYGLLLVSFWMSIVLLLDR